MSQRQGISSHLRTICGAWSFPRVAVLILIFKYIETFASGNLSGFLNEVKPLDFYDVEHGIVMEPMKGKWASFQVVLGYTEILCIPEVTAVFLSTFDSGLRDSLVFHQAH